MDKLNVRPHNLPAQLTPLIGREEEVAIACTLLRRSEVRLVTFTGTGGVGKTRLSLQVATELLDDFADGICFVPLAAVSDFDLVVPTITRVLGLKEAGDQPLLNFLKAYLQDKRLLLLLDNFEQVLEAAPELSDLLTACSYLKILVTSRAVLHIQGEYEFPVPPLPLPDLTHLPESEALLQYAAVALFLRCAQAVKPDFQMTPANTRAIAEICVRLDGLPLAIELAGARIKLLPPQALLARLEHRLQILTKGAQDVPARQQTLRNMLAWSYELLDVREQSLFRRLSVFASGSTLEAVEALYDMPAYVLDGAGSLIDKSLLYQTEQDGGEPRLMMLETIREYALEALAESGEMEDTRWAHAAYYLRLAEEAESGLPGPQQAVWLECLEREHNNLRAALQWSLEQAGKEETEQSTGNGRDMSLRLAGALGSFWWVHGHLSEGRNFLERALAASESVGASPASAKALFTAANLAFVQSDYERALALSEGSLAVCRELGDKRGIALSLYPLGNVAWTRGNMAAARTMKEEALALFKELNDKGFVAWSLFSLALLDSSQGEYARACTLFEESLTIQKELGNKQGIAHSLAQLAQTLFVSQGDQARVSMLLEECLALSQEVGFKEGVAAYCCLSGQIALCKGDIVMAHTLAKKSVDLYKEIGHRHGTAESLAGLGKVVAAQGD
ncbi:MAG: ATP-binding protein, partial [Ktedonobacteraceae bacterium]